MSYSLAALTSPQFAALVADDRAFVVLQPVGSVEPHGPHMSLVTDTVISVGACTRAARELESRDIVARIAPAIPYGVTHCAEKFPGAISVDADVLTPLLAAVVHGYLVSGVDHVCLVNNHLEPEHDAAVRAAIVDVETGKASVACPLTRRWARTLSVEFKSGACHAGQYETSIVLACDASLVDESRRVALPEVPISLAEKLRAGVTDFVEMGLAEAYAGDPAAASAAEGDELLDRLAAMIRGEVTDSLTAGCGETP